MTKKSSFYFVILCLLSVPAWLPLFYTLTGSFMPAKEAAALYGAVTQGTGGVSYWPHTFSLEGYYQVFIAAPHYLYRFWVSVAVCGLIVVGQLAVSILAAYSFAKYRFPGKRPLFGAMILFMLMPVQVTLLPNYIILERLGLLNTYQALILPNIFLPFGTFLLTFTFSKISDEMIEAAKMDGAGVLRTLFSIVIPSGTVGITSLALLTFIDCWNMVEQPIVFLQNTEYYPLSVFLASTGAENASLQFVCGILCMVPVALLFWIFKKELMQSVDLSGVKL